MRVRIKRAFNLLFGEIGHGEYMYKLHRELNKKNKS